MKKNRTKLYAKALAEAILNKKSEGNKVSDNFVKLLVKTGQIKKAKEILNLAQDIILAKQGKRKITLQTARKMTESQKKLMDGFIKDGDVVKEKIDPDLIAGIKIIINDAKQYDASLQSKLQKIKA